MRRRIGIYGVTDEVLALIPLLMANPEIEIVRSFDADPQLVKGRLGCVDPAVAALVEQTLTTDPRELASDTSLTAVIGADPDTDFGEHLPAGARSDVQVVTPLAARMLWGYAAGSEPAPTRASGRYDTERRSFQRETGLADAGFLARRTGEELSRADARRGSLALTTTRIENLGELDRHGDPSRSQRVVERVIAALRARSRDVDVLGRIAEGEFVLLLPDAGPSPHDRVLALVRAVARDVAMDEPLNEPVRIALSFGYASHPEHGGAARELIERAREPRIRML